jgi:CHASE3 domain sensor protein
MLLRFCKGSGLIIWLVLAFVAVESIVAASFLSIVHFQDANNWVKRSQNVLLELEQIIKTLSRAESSHLGYVITGSDHHLTSYHEAFDATKRQMQHLDNLTKGDVAQRDRVAYFSAI